MASESKKPKKVEAPARGSAYTVHEDKNILNYIRDNDLYDKVKGKTIWEKMALTFSIQGKGRTWQGLKERYVKQIIPNLKEHIVDHALRDKYVQPFNLNSKNRVALKGKPQEIRSLQLNSRKMFNKAKDKGINKDVQRIKDSSKRGSISKRRSQVTNPDSRSSSSPKKRPRVIDSESDSNSSKEDSEDSIAQPRRSFRLSALPPDTSSESTFFEVAAETECNCSDFEGTDSDKKTPCSSKCKVFVTSTPMPNNNQKRKEGCRFDDLQGKKTKPRRSQDKQEKQDPDTFMDPLFKYFNRNKTALPYIVVNGEKMCLGSFDFPVLHPPFHHLS